MLKKVQINSLFWMREINFFVAALSVYCGISSVIGCHGPTKSVGEERGGVDRKRGRRDFTQVQVSRNGSLLPARFTISGVTIPVRVTMDDLNCALRRLPSGLI